MSSPAARLTRALACKGDLNIPPIRRPLQLQLLAAWRNTIENHYDKCLLNSERSLQASFWSHIVAELPNNRRTFIEPRIKHHRGPAIPRIYPDILVCNSQTVIAVIEIKYTPKTPPQFKKDINTLNWVAKNKSRLYVENNRYQGDASETEWYDFADNTLFVWAGVHRPRENPGTLFQGVQKTLRKALMQLHAETGDSTVVVRSPTKAG